MGILGSLKSSLQSSFDRKREEREYEERIRKESEIQRMQEVGLQNRQREREMAIAQAKMDINRKFGIERLRAINRVNTLTDPNSSVSGFSKLSEYTQKNKARAAMNIQKTQEMREAAKRLREERLAQEKFLREQRIAMSHARKLNKYNGKSS